MIFFILKQIYKKNNLCEIDFINKDPKYTFIDMTYKERRYRQIWLIAVLLGYKVFDLQGLNFANISLGNLDEGHLKLIDFNQIQNLK